MNKRRVILGLFAVLAALPPLTAALDQPYYLEIVRQALILALAAMALDILMGYGGLVSLCQAAFVGIGAYAVGILGFHGLGSGGLHLLAAVGAAALMATAIGALSLGARGLAFIMVTLAFGQMLHHAVAGLDAYGGDDGLILVERSRLGPVDLYDDWTFYYLVLALVALWALVLRRAMAARFGLVLRAARQNADRLRALGMPVRRHQLTAFALAGAVAGLAGFLNANHADFVSPDMLHWTRSAELVVIVMLGGLHSVLGPILGALALVVGETLAADITHAWHLAVGIAAIGVALFAPGGLWRLAVRDKDRDDA